MQLNGDLLKAKYELDRHWPAFKVSNAPENTPDNVARFFKQATDSLHAKNYDASGIMFRKTLESATKLIDQDLGKIPLAKRINELVSRQLITPALGEWADEIRLGGNEAAHDDDFYSKEDADALHDFTENFLKYTFTLPAAVAKRSSVEIVDR